MQDPTRPGASPHPDVIRAAKCHGCGRTYCVCPRRQLEVATPAEAIALIRAAGAAGEPVLVAEVPTGGQLLRGAA